MANFPESRVYIQTEQVQTRKPVSENLMQGIAATANHYLTKHLPYYKFAVNGYYSGAAGQNGIDGVLPLPYQIKIIDVKMYIGEVGSGGSTEFDIKYCSTPGGSFTSIFSTRPAANTSAATQTYVGLGQTVTGWTTPVLTSSNIIIPSTGALRLDIIGTMTGQPVDAGILIYYMPT